MAPVSTPLPNNQSTTPKRSRAEQARINGAKSKGPVSDAGRARSQRAKLQHGRYARSEATGASFLLKNEDPTQFDLFRRGWLALLGPQSDAETEFLDGFIANEWRIIRFQAAETGLINDEMRRNRPKVDPGIQHLSPADRELSRLAQAVSGLYEKSPAANALDLQAVMDAIPAAANARIIEGRMTIPFGLWPVTLRAPLRAFLASGAKTSVRAFADAHDAARADFPDDGAFTNLNTPQDLAQAEARLSALS
jgi:hypothetical protein